MLVALLLSLLGLQLDEVVNPEDGDGRLRRELEALDLGDGGLEDAGFLVVPDDALVEVQAVVLHVGVVGLGLARVVVGAEFGDELGGVLGGVHGQRLGDHQQGVRELGNGQLFSEEDSKLFEFLSNIQNTVIKISWRQTS